jgi:hypothetical protein
LGRRSLLLGAIIVLLLVGTSDAGAAGTFTDPAGDAVGGATDITQVAVSNDFDGNITFALTTNRSAFTSDDLLVIVLDTDKNQATGTKSIDYAIVTNSTGATLVRGTGTGFTPVAAPTLLSANSGMTITVNRSDLGGTTGFAFALVSSLRSNTTVGDSAPDTGSWTYDLDLKPVLDTLAAHFSPAKPKAGKVFRLAGTTLRLENGTIVKADSISCAARLNGKRLAGRCSWRIPASARGKRLTVFLTAHYKGASATFTPWRFVVR